MKFKPNSYVSVADAVRKIEQHIDLRTQTEIVAILDSYKRVLAEDIVSNVDVPAYNRSHMDGFAVKSKDILHASRSEPITLTISNTKIELGNPPDHIINNKEAYKISTGGYLPMGSDTVVPIEECEMDGKELKIFTPFRNGSFVYPMGSDIKKGEIIFTKGKVLRVQDIALLSSICFRVPVFRKPCVALIPTGSELTELENPEQGKIPDTHSHIILRLIEEIGGIPFRLGVTPDEVLKIHENIIYACTSSDLILTMGGSSVGDHDLVEEAVNSIGNPGILIHGIKLDRGRVTGLGVVKGKPIIVLPGPIQGALNAFIMFAYPLLRSLCGKNSPLVTIWAILAEEWSDRKRFPTFTKIVYVKLSKLPDGFKASPLIGETESLTILTKAHGYIIVPEETTNIKIGQIVEVNLLPGFSYVADQFID